MSNPTGNPYIAAALAAQAAKAAANTPDATSATAKLSAAMATVADNAKRLAGGKAGPCPLVDPNACKKAGYACRNGDDCKDNAYCRVVVGQSNTCRLKPNTTDVPDGSYCEKSANCTGGLCYNWKCTPRAGPCTIVDPNACKKAGFGCRDGRDCADNAYCRVVAGQPNTCRLNPSNTNVPDGSYCEKSANCAGGLCYNWKCTKRAGPCPILDPTVCKSKGFSCRDSRDCADNAYCRVVVGQPNTCRLNSNVRGLPNGQYCEQAANCAGGYCNGYVCSDVAPSCGFMNVGQCIKDVEYLVYFFIAVVIFWYLGIPALSSLGSYMSSKKPATKLV